ncbi:hypothetical protein K432DRAFT_382106 [Lepidopterella palustris CBS 459.81]|uniref:F-box domain-containing protein n=1 Tax=Lepidopterella palustris CBS 459.81 TaxID=1314670 RepID=A0A8E2EB55_9PEZI|nr:hypothetical protein K432DRAFT_382106 [Lepidopterella palustris CBS 459.81]
MIVSAQAAATSTTKSQAEGSDETHEICVTYAENRTELVQHAGHTGGHHCWLTESFKTLVTPRPATEESETRSGLLTLPRELRDQIFGYLIPFPSRAYRPGLQTCVRHASVVGNPWRFENFEYNPSVPKWLRLDSTLLLINSQIKEECLQAYLRRSNLKLHTELQNTNEDELRFTYSPHLFSLPFLRYVSRLHLSVNWFRNIAADDMCDEAYITSVLLQTIDSLLETLQCIQVIELSIAFFWKSKGRNVVFSLEDSCNLMDVFVDYAEAKWLNRLGVKSHGTRAQNLDGEVGMKIYAKRGHRKQRTVKMDMIVSITLGISMKEQKPSLKATQKFDGALPQLPTLQSKPSVLSNITRMWWWNRKDLML